MMKNIGKKATTPFDTQVNTQFPTNQDPPDSLPKTIAIQLSNCAKLIGTESNFCAYYPNQSPTIALYALSLEKY